MEILVKITLISIFLFSCFQSRL